MYPSTRDDDTDQRADRAMAAAADITEILRRVPIQILRQHLMVTDHDLPVDLIATPRAVIDVERQYDRPRGILWDHLQPPQIREIPVLERMGYA